jgi:hypothetical protein
MNRIRIEEKVREGRRLASIVKCGGGLEMQKSRRSIGKLMLL